MQRSKEFLELLLDVSQRVANESRDSVKQVFLEQVENIKKELLQFQKPAKKQKKGKKNGKRTKK